MDFSIRITEKGSMPIVQKEKQYKSMMNIFTIISTINRKENDDV